MPTHIHTLWVKAGSGSRTQDLEEQIQVLCQCAITQVGNLYVNMKNFMFIEDHGTYMCYVVIIEGIWIVQYKVKAFFVVYSGLLD